MPVSIELQFKIKQQYLSAKTRQPWLWRSSISIYSSLTSKFNYPLIIPSLDFTLAINSSYGLRFLRPVESGRRFLPNRRIHAFSHHIVSLTSTTYGLLTLDAPPSPEKPKILTPSTPSPQPPPRTTLGSLFPSPLSEPRSHRYQPYETINSWDLMSGLDSDHTPSFRFTPLKNSNSNSNQIHGNDENASPNFPNLQRQSSIAKDLNRFLEGFKSICPPNGETKVVLYTTSLRGVRKTFEDCNAVRSAIQGLGISICERDISMDRGFRDELRELLGMKESVPPRLFVKGRYIGGAEEVMKIVEEGSIGELLQGLPKLITRHVCDGCGGVGFLPCFLCHGSCKMVMVMREGEKKNVVVRCTECNENGLVLCPICS